MGIADVATFDEEMGYEVEIMRIIKLGVFSDILSLMFGLSFASTSETDKGIGRRLYRGRITLWTVDILHGR